MNTLEEILNKINEAESIVLLVHENPDGDAIGSGLAMYQGLKNIGKSVEFIVPKYPHIFKELPYAGDIAEVGTKDSYDLAISIDCASQNQLSTWYKYFEASKSTIVIDHHISNSEYGMMNFVEGNSPACAQTLYKIFKKWNWNITKDMGTCLLAGIITDTGGFQYCDVTKETFNVAAEILDLGVDLSKTYKQVYSTFTKTSLILRGKALSRMEFLFDGKLAFTYINQKDEEGLEVLSGDYDGIVNEGRNIEGVEVSVFLHEREDGAYKISFRANDYLNVSEIASNLFEGGGHVRAAGAVATGTLEEIKEKILREIEKNLK